MKLSEKTLELNFCYQFPALSKCNVLWLGLTQRQEAQEGFDVCAKMHGRLIIFQFKAPTKALTSNRFRLNHEQLRALKETSISLDAEVYYAFPLLSVTAEISHKQNVPEHTWLLDVSRLPMISEIPVSNAKQPMHSVLIQPNKAIASFTSRVNGRAQKPLNIKIFPATDLAEKLSLALGGSKVSKNEDIDEVTVALPMARQYKLRGFENSELTRISAVAGVFFRAVNQRVDPIPKSH